MKKIYIAGKVSGEQIVDCTLKFLKAKIAIEALGFEAVNPLSIVNDWKMAWKPAMKLCINELFECDAVYFLPDWNLSKGACAEKNLAQALELACYYDLKDIPLMGQPSVCRSEDLFREKQQAMTNKELSDLVCEETTKMCRTGGKSFTMQVPVNVKDTDMLISELVRRFRVLSNCG